MNFIELIRKYKYKTLIELTVSVSLHRAEEIDSCEDKHRLVASYIL